MAHYTTVCKLHGQTMLGKAKYIPKLNLNDIYGVTSWSYGSSNCVISISLVEASCFYNQNLAHIVYGHMQH